MVVYTDIYSALESIRKHGLACDIDSNNKLRHIVIGCKKLLRKQQMLTGYLLVFV